MSMPPTTNRHNPGLPPVDRATIDQPIATVITQWLFHYPTMQVLPRLEPFTETLVLQHFPLEAAYPALVGLPPPTNYSYVPLRTDSRSRLLAIGGTFWERVARTAAQLPLMTRVADGTQTLTDTDFTGPAAMLSRLAPKTAVETWIVAVVDWLHRCALGSCLPYRNRDYGLPDPPPGMTITEVIAWQEAAYIELYAW